MRIRNRRKAKLTTTIMVEGGARAVQQTAVDVRMVVRAVKNRWPIPAAKKPEIVKRLLDIVTRPKSDDRGDTNAMRAAQVLAMMEAQNQTDQLAIAKDARLDEGKITERLAVEPVIVERPI